LSSATPKKEGIAEFALVFSEAGRWKEAEELGVGMMEIRKRVLGEEHRNTPSSMANLAYIWKSQSHKQEAISLMKRCFQLRI